MAWGRRRRATGVGWHALLPIPLTGGMLSGEVRDSDDRPVAGARVTVLDQTGVAVACLDTDAFGLFVASVALGPVRVRVEAGGYTGLDHRVTVDWGAHHALGRLVVEPDLALTAPPPGVYVVDPDHSSVRFVARHIAMSRVYGRFRTFEGAIRIAERFEDSAAQVRIDAATVFTNSAKRDEHLRSPDFLDVERFPHLHFTSSRFTRLGGDRWRVDGELTVRGTTSDVHLDTTFLGMREWNGMRAGVLATTTLHREHYTVNWQQMIAKGIPVVGSTVAVELDVQAVRG